MHSVKVKVTIAPAPVEFEINLENGDTYRDLCQKVMIKLHHANRSLFMKVQDVLSFQDGNVVPRSTKEIYIQVTNVYNEKDIYACPPFPAPPPFLEIGGDEQLEVDFDKLTLGK